ncbi:MAG: GNAT family N-acetyltransferase [Acidimicrobiales bacterium]
MPELQLVRSDHGPAILTFELENRGYFSESISDRGDDYFDGFDQRHHELLGEQEAGVGASYVLVDDDGSILGRFNLYRIQEGVAEVGYRVGQRAAGRGVATAALRELCQLATSQHGLRLLRAATSDHNIASQRVLTKAGFVPAGPADPADIGGKQGRWYRRDLTAVDPDRSSQAAP